MGNKRKTTGELRDKFGPTWLWLIPSTVLFIKIITIFNIPGYVWLGADGESYLDGVNGLISEGLFSEREKLQYFPAGYPILIWIFSKLSINYALLILSIFQSLVFAFSTWYFAKKLATTSLSVVNKWLLIFISINPTLTLSSLVVGYESLVASMLLLSAGVLISINSKADGTIKKVILFSVFTGLASFIQPRYLATAAIVLIVYLHHEFGMKGSLKFVSISLAVLMIFPLGLGLRNQQATDKFFVSNNLGVTMNVGAGPEATGGYTNKATGVPCKPEPQTDNQKVVCVLKWYATNPDEILRLSFNKTVYFFSPWSGPLANGTMARNPWLKVNPIAQTAKTPDGFKMVYGGFGKLVSWTWLVGQLSLMIWGAVWLWRKGEDLRRLSILAISMVTVSWLVAVGTIGDHRFRMPIIAFMLLLQVAGLRGFSKKPLILKSPAKRR